MPVVPCIRCGRGCVFLCRPCRYPLSQALLDAVLSSLTPDLLKKQYVGLPFPGGHCYVASEALYHLLGRHPHVKAQWVWHEDVSHWFVSTDGKIIDLTAEQFDTPPLYAEANGKGFLTKYPSKRARVVIERVVEKMGV